MLAFVPAAFVPAKISEAFSQHGRLPLAKTILWVFHFKKRHKHILRTRQFLGLRYSADFGRSRLVGTMWQKTHTASLTASPFTSKCQSNLNSCDIILRSNLRISCYLRMLCFSSFETSGNHFTVYEGEWIRISGWSWGIKGEIQTWIVTSLNSVEKLIPVLHSARSVWTRRNVSIVYFHVLWGHLHMTEPGLKILWWLETISRVLRPHRMYSSLP